MLEVLNRSVRTIRQTLADYMEISALDWWITGYKVDTIHRSRPKPRSIQWPTTVEPGKKYQHVNK